MNRVSMEEIGSLNIFFSVIVPAVISLLTVLITSALKRPELRYAERAKIIGDLADKRIKGVIEFRSALAQMQQFERFCALSGYEEFIAEADDLVSISIVQAESIISVLSGKNALQQSLSEINQLLECYSFFLTRKTRAALTCLSHFLFYLLEHEDYSSCTDLAIAITPGRDIAKQLLRQIRKTDLQLCKEMNIVRTRYECNVGLQWNFWFWFYDKKYSRLRKEVKKSPFVTQSKLIYQKINNT